MLNVNNFIAFEFTLCKFIFCNLDRKLNKQSIRNYISYNYFIEGGFVETFFQRYYT